MMVLKGNGYIIVHSLCWGGGGGGGGGGGVDDQALKWLPSLMLTQYPCGPRGCVHVSCTLC